MTSAALKLEKAVRAFRFNNMPLPDPDPKLTADQVKEFYANIYPELTNAEIEGPTQKGAEIIYEFRKAVGTKGNDELPGKFEAARLGLAGTALIMQERDRQMREKGYSAEHDDEHADHSIAAAACAYAAPEPLYIIERFSDGTIVSSDVFPKDWAQRWDKRKRGSQYVEGGQNNIPLSADDYTPDERIRNLVKAGALIAAEIDRLIRKQSNG